MVNFNLMVLMGRLVANPEIKAINNERNVAKFTVVTSRSYKDRHDEWQEISTFVDAELWGTPDRVEFFKNRFHKGSNLLVRGSIKQDKWKSAEGENRSKLIMEVQEFEAIDPKEQSESSGEDRDPPKEQSKPVGKSPQKQFQNTSQTRNKGEVVKEDDIPF